MLRERNNRKISVLILICIILLVGCRKEPAVSLEEADTKTVSTEKKEEAKTGDSNNQEILSKESLNIAVFVCGAVNKSGVYELPAGSRLYEAIDAAGGFTEQAAQTYLNQAEALSDGQKIYVPTNQEVTDGLVEDSGASVEMDDKKADDKKANGKININTASAQELMAIPGIGEAKAASIIKYREANGKFQTIEDIMNIEGIKEGIFHKMQDYITV